MKTILLLKRQLLAFLVLTILNSFVKSADYVHVLPITNKILVVFLDEGHIDYGPATDYINGNIVYRHSVQATDVENKSNYLITSENDANYSTSKTPANIGRKAKLIEYHTIYAGSNKWCLGHWVYIELPNAMQRGLTYTVTLAGNLANQIDNKVSQSFVFNEFDLRSPTIQVNQVGYKTTAPKKYAYLSRWMGDFDNGTHTAGGLELDDFSGAKFHVLRLKDNFIAYTGTINKRYEKTQIEASNQFSFFDHYSPERNYSHADVWECDFSPVKDTGEYVIVVEGIGRSYPFMISKDPYRTAYYATSKGIFSQRSGIHKLIEPHVEAPRDHHPDDIDVLYDKDYKYWLVGSHSLPGWDDAGLPKVNIWGGYHDAGDWDKYPHHSKIPLNIMWAYDLKPENYADGDVANQYKLSASGSWINEGSNGLPDILDEAKWLIEFDRRARDEIQNNHGGTGGIPGEYCGRDAGASSGPWQDTRTWPVTAESPVSSYYFAATAGYFSECLKIWNSLGGSVPQQEIDDYLAEAEAAYAWAENYCANNPADCGLFSERHAAAAILYRATGNTQYQTDCMDELRQNTAYTDNHGDWSNINLAQITTYIMANLPSDHPNLDGTFYQETRDKLKAIADGGYLSQANKRSYRLGWEFHRSFSLGTFSTPRVMLPASAYKVFGDEEYLELCYYLGDYMLGGNPLNQSQMTQVGENPNKYVFHPTSWQLNDYNSKVYSNETVMGMLTYFGDVSSWVSGPGDEREMRKSAYPDISAWPESESRFDTRPSINGSEFTTHQNNSQALATYGFLCEPPDGSFTPNQRPTISVTYPNQNDQFQTGSDIQIEVNPSADVRRVEYYFDEHFIGATETKPFTYIWEDAPAGNYVITAKAFDDEGLLVRPNNPENDVDVSIQVGSYGNVGASGVNIENCPSQDLTLNRIYQLVYTVSPADATNKNVTWSSSNSAVASVNAQGQVYTKNPGSATITVTTNDGNHTATCNITVKPLSSPTSVEITNEKAISIGETYQLEYEILPVDAFDKTVSWSSSNPSIVSVNASGQITGVAQGSANITVTTNDGNKTDVVSISVTYIEVTDVLVENFYNLPSLNNNTAKYQMNVELLPANASDQNLSWSVDNGTIASIDANGLLSINQGQSGQITVTATSADGPSGSVTMNVNPQGTHKIPGFIHAGLYDAVGGGVTPSNNYNGDEGVQVISDFGSGYIEFHNLEVEIGGDYQIISRGANGMWNGASADYEFEHQGNTTYIKYEWTGTGEVANDGWWTYETHGPWNANFTTGTATATLTEVVNACNISWLYFKPLDVSSDYTLTINATNGTVAKNPNKSIFSPGETVTLTANPNTGYDFANWSGDATGSTNPITVTMNAYKTITANFTVCASAVTSVSIDNCPSGDLYADQTVDLTESLTGSCGAPDNTNVTWSTSDNTNSSVNASGVVSFSAAGVYTITVTTEDGGYTDNCVITVINRPVTDVSVTPTTLNMSISETSDLTEIITPSNATDKSVNWSSSNTGVATVDGNGLVTAVGNGTANITVTTNDGGHTATCAVNVSTSVTGVSVSPTTLNLDNGQTSDLTETVSPSNASNKNVTWTSSKTSVATVDANGLVTAVGGGTCVITVTTADGGFQATCNVTVTVPVSSVTIDNCPGNMTVNEVFALTHSILPADASNTNVSWTSSNTSVATVDASGTVTAKADGNATITVTTQDGSQTSTCDLVVSTGTEPVTGVTLDKTTVDITKGNTSQLTATIEPSNASDKSVSWSSDNTSIATVSATGLVTAVDAGSATITVTTNDGSFTATCDVTVTIAVDGVDVTPANSTIDLGSTIQLSATVSPANATNQNVTWTSSDPSAATVDQTGLVTSLSDNTVIITATTEDGGYSDISTITIIPAVTDVNVTPANSSLTVGSTEQLAVEVLPSNAPDLTVTWSSSNTSVVTVSASGLVTAIAEGSATITATSNSDGSITGSCYVVVGIPVSGVVVTPEDLVLNVGSSWTLEALVSPYNAEDPSITWTSKDESVATVNSTGLVNAIGSGNTYIIAKTNDGGYADSCLVTSRRAVTGVEISDTSLKMKAGYDAETHQLNVVVYPANADDKTGVWSSSNPQVANVDQTGLVSAISNGTAAIIFTTNDGSFSASCNVYVTTDLASISFNVSSISMEPGDISYLTVLFDPPTASNKNISVVNTDTVVVKSVVFNNIITLTADSTGKAIITAQSEDGNFVAACEVLVQTTDINLDDVASGIMVYPNPVHTYLNITNTREGDEISITNILGQRFIKQDGQEERSDVDVSSLENGLYIISIIRGSEVIKLSKFIKN